MSLKVYMHPRNNSTNRFSLFEKFAGDYKNKKILDYGGNRGNLLYFSQGKIKEENYTCIDVEKDAIENGKKEFPGATFIHYNRFSPMYNDGNINESFPSINNQYDICFSFSTFTHTDLYTFIETMSYLTRKSKYLVISFVSTENIGMKNWVYTKRRNEYGSCVDLDIDCDYFYLVNNDKIYIEEEIFNNKCKYFFAFYNPSFIKKIFNCNIILNSQGQDFMVIKL